MFRNSFSFLQRVGKALMIPVAVLPVAGLLLGIGSAGFEWIPPIVSELMRQGGDVIFANMALLFAVAVAISFCDNDGVAAIAAVVGYVVLLATLGVMARVWGDEPVTVMGIPTLQTGVFGGILAGAVAAAMFQRYYRITLPPWLGFFAGKRFVPIVTALVAILFGIVLSVVWPPVQRGIDVFSHWAAVGDPRSAATIYGFVERLLVPFGLHHIWNAPFFYEIGSFVDATGKVVHGDIPRYFAGDRTAGILGGAYLFKMFGLPAAAMAIWRCALPENRKAVGGIMLSGALTSFLTGITEPIEFSFLFVAPLLYLVHAFLVASAQFVMASLDAHLGFTFSQGMIDFVMFNVLNATSQRWWLVLVLGPVYGAVYYGAFVGLIRAFHLATPGREAKKSVPSEEAQGAPTGSELGAELVLAFGGRENLVGLDACVTRLRVEVRDPAKVDAERIKALGATGVVRVGNGVQAVFGPRSEALKLEMEAHLRGTAPARKEDRGAAAGDGAIDLDAPAHRALVEALGGRANVRSLRPIALTRLRAELIDPSLLDEAAAERAGIRAVMRAGGEVVHLLLGGEASGAGRL